MSGDGGKCLEILKNGRRYMKIYTMGFKGKSQEEFIKTINKKKIELVVDMRERNRFPMLGFCNEGELKKCLKGRCNCDYLYNSMLAPMCGYYEAYTERAISWDEYVAKYKETLSERGIAGRFLIDCMEYERIMIICLGKTPGRCSRKLLAEWLQERIRGIEIEIKHL